MSRRGGSKHLLPTPNHLVQSSLGWMHWIHEVAGAGGVLPEGSGVCLDEVRRFVELG